MHPLGFVNDFVVYCDLLLVQCVDDEQLLQTLDTGEHHVCHARLMHAGNIHHQGLWLGNCLPLKLLTYQMYQGSKDSKQPVGIVGKKRDPGILDPELFSGQIRKVEARLGKLAKIRKVETD